MAPPLGRVLNITFRLPMFNEFQFGGVMFKRDTYKNPIKWRATADTDTQNGASTPIIPSAKL